jgi:hypothetical protein
LAWPEQQVPLSASTLCGWQTGPVHVLEAASGSGKKPSPHIALLTVAQRANGTQQASLSEYSPASHVAPKHCMPAAAVLYMKSEPQKSVSLATVRHCAGSVQHVP